MRDPELESVGELAQRDVPDGRQRDDTAPDRDRGRTARRRLAGVPEHEPRAETAVEMHLPRERRAEDRARHGDHARDRNGKPDADPGFVTLLEREEAVRVD